MIDRGVTAIVLNMFCQNPFQCIPKSKDERTNSKVYLIRLKVHRQISKFKGHTVIRITPWIFITSEKVHFHTIANLT